MKPYLIPLFPLNLVICPDGLVPLKIFEPRYLDMVTNCVLNKTTFCIVAVLPEGETDTERNFPFANVGTVVEVIDADFKIPGLILIRCLGKHRVKITAYSQLDDGLLIGQAIDIENEKPTAIPPDLILGSKVLGRIVHSFSGETDHSIPLIEPYRLEDAVWVANRWVELLDLPIIEKQRLMQLDSPILRLELINDILESGHSEVL